MAQKNETSACALAMEELENVNGGARVPTVKEYEERRFNRFFRDVF